MHHGIRLLTRLVLVIALLTPATTIGAARPQQEQREQRAKGGAKDQNKNNTGKRVYDRAQKDYHFWNEAEDKAYRQYLNDRHMKYRPLSKQSHDQQREYWNLRHNQPPYLE